MQTIMATRGRVQTGRRLQRLQRSFLLFAGGFLALLLLSVVLSSKSRTSKLLGGSMSEDPAISRPEDSKLHLQEFSRTQIKDGRQTSQVKGKDAKYFSKEDVTYIKEATVRVFRNNAAPVDLHALSAKLYMDGEKLLRADLEGNVTASSQSGATLHTELATYSADEKLITAPGPVKIDGTGYTIEGVGMDMIVEADLISIHEQVRSRFEQGSSVPSILPTAEEANSKKKK